MEIKKDQKTQKPIPPVGVNVSRCYSIVDLGTQMESYMGAEPKPAHKVHFSWECPDSMHVFDQTKGPQPLGIFQEFTASLGDKSKLKPMLCAWRNVSDMLEVKLEDYLGKPCMINVVHKPEKGQSLPAGTGLKKDGKIYYGNYGSLMALAKGLVCKPQINPSIHFSLDKFSWETFNKLPKHLQEKITKSLEWSGIIATHGQNPQAAANTQAAQHSAPAGQGMQQNDGFGNETTEEAPW